MGRPPGVLEKLGLVAQAVGLGLVLVPMTVLAGVFTASGWLLGIWTRVTLRAALIASPKTRAVYKPPPSHANIRLLRPLVRRARGR